MKRWLILVLLSLIAACAPTNQEALPPSPSGSSPSPELGAEPAAFPEGSPEGSEPRAYQEPAAAPAGRYARPPDDAADPAGWRPSADPGDFSRDRAAPTTPAYPSASPSPRPPVASAPRVDAPSAAEPSVDHRSSDRSAKQKGPASAFEGERGGAGMGSADESGVSSGRVGGAVAELSRPAPKPQPEDRPGLGTNWGETRYSAVSEVPFERDSGRPAYTASLGYNDERGAYALAARDSSAYATTASIGLGTALTLSLRSEYGGALSAYRGSGRTVAVGSHGQRYSIVVQNNTNERFEVVLSVDGLDVLDGRDAGFGKRGYLIEPYGVIEVDGFRQSNDAVAAFRFGSVGESYAARTGSARNVGVIGAAAFGERGYSARLQAYRERLYAQRQMGYEVERRYVAEPFPNQYATPPLRVGR